MAGRPRLSSDDRRYLGLAGWVAAIGGVLLLLPFGIVAMAMSLDARAIATLSFNLLAGPWLYLERILPQIRPKLDAWLTAIACVALLAVASHFFFGWLYRNWGQPNAAPRTWKKRWTLCFVASLLLLFSAGVAAIGMVHQTGWLLNSSTPAYRIEPARPYPTATPSESRP